MEKKNDIVLIQSHCDDEYSKEVLLDNIKKLKEYDVDIYYFHIYHYLSIL